MGANRFFLISGCFNEFIAEGIAARNFIFNFSALLIGCSDSGGELPVPDSSVLDQASGSSGQQAEAEDSAPSEQKLLLAVAEEIILPNYLALRRPLIILLPNGPLEAYCDLGPEALTGSSGFRDSFRELVNAVEATEMHALGQQWQMLRRCVIRSPLIMTANQQLWH